jgi:hypothetical protein
MGTRSRIGIENEDGSVTSIYCHFDGYLSHVGRILHTSYTTEEKIRALMGLGDLSSLGEEIGEQHPFRNPYQGGTREWEAMERQCTSYGRDRGDPDTDARMSANRKAYLKMSQSFTYLWSNGLWLVLSEEPVPHWMTLEETLHLDSLEDEDEESKE